MTLPRFKAVSQATAKARKEGGLLGRSGSGKTFPIPGTQFNQSPDPNAISIAGAATVPSPNTTAVAGAAGQVGSNHLVNANINLPAQLLGEAAAAAGQSRTRGLRSQSDHAGPPQIGVAGFDVGGPGRQPIKRFPSPRGVALSQGSAQSASVAGSLPRSVGVRAGAETEGATPDLGPQADSSAAVKATAPTKETHAGESSHDDADEPESSQTVSQSVTQSLEQSQAELRAERAEEQLRQVAHANEQLRIQLDEQATRNRS